MTATHVFLTHGGPGIGLGHVRRCLALARCLSARGAAVTFIISPDQAVKRLVEASGFGVAELPWEVDFPAAIRTARDLGADAVVVDSYAATTAMFEALRATVEQVAVIDDLADRPLPVDVVINGGVSAESLTYAHTEATLLLLGPQYALIDTAYAVAPMSRARARIERVLVTLGGALQTPALRSAVAAVDAALGSVIVDVVAGPYADAAAVVGDVVRCPTNRVVVHGPVSDLRPLMLEADVAVSGAGMTLYELAATATPSVMVLTAANQRLNVKGFVQAGAALFAGEANSVELGTAVESRLRELVASMKLRAALGTAARRLVDGQGALRLARAMAGDWSARRSP
jgi:UDP-2,4-diacetamido-2,4,6-trideoxy-beta-L-altropyranose hydrolase